MFIFWSFLAMLQSLCNVHENCVPFWIFQFSFTFIEYSWHWYQSMRTFCLVLIFTMTNSRSSLLDWFSLLTRGVHSLFDESDSSSAWKFMHFWLILTFQNIFSCVPQPTETHTDLEWHWGDSMMTIFTFEWIISLNCGNSYSSWFLWRISQINAYTFK